MKKDKNTNATKPWLKALTFVGKIVTALAVALVLFWFGFVCEVREGNCAVILRFGAVRQEITDAGIYLKLPWPFETVVSYDSRLQYLESGDLEVTTSDSRNIIIQSYVVWQVKDPVLYHNSVGVQGTANAYITEAVKSAINGTMGGYQLSDLVYAQETAEEEFTTPDIAIEETTPAETIEGTVPVESTPAETIEGTVPVETTPAESVPVESTPEETVPEEATQTPPVGGTKIEQIQDDIFQRVQKVCAENYGIDIVDVRILRLSLPAVNLDDIFNQMEADRRKEIERIIAEAEQKATQITLDAAEESAQIIADGIITAAQIDAQTEAEVAKIYAEAQAANIELYQFLMDMDTFANSVDETTILVVKADEYPFNILTTYSQKMTVSGNDMVISDLTYILSQLPEKDRTALTTAISKLIEQAATRNSIPLE